MGNPDSEIDAATEISVNGFVFWFTTSSRVGVHGLDEFSKFPISPNNRLEIEPVTTFESVPDQHAVI